MKKHPTLEELVKERGLKPHVVEKQMGITKGTGWRIYVAIHYDGTYHTFYKGHIKAMETLHQEVVIVRG